MVYKVCTLKKAENQIDLLVIRCTFVPVFNELLKGDQS